mmetsp:Transcript_14769/g.19470  ORF Transcript_14769/g.19470 Transcript_14769/m.19470 type:complete len:357 (+) Transcript_14769:137-1207(+)|eukprot:CAMPEP_0117750956 /NCGR_PEP_ID=MMETSP0947-20121206/10682_1 /TAXON_ID=44440 /ORGANISM="Chattonella subsalsa, Strain CCMP2191" /LENGTH=356 /DNA_ID=CAMNT_0005569233 /DNA_START=134 /DNA_END=1204 /DNA_ORIENTATION=+
MCEGSKVTKDEVGVEGSSVASKAPVSSTSTPYKEESYMSKLFFGALTWGTIYFLIKRYDDLTWLEAYWNIMLEKFTEFQISTFITFVLHESMYFMWFVPWYIIDQIPYFKKFKIQPNKTNDGPQMWKCFKTLMFNHIFIQMPMMLMTHSFLKFFDFTMEAPLPSLSSIAWKIPLFFIVEDFYFYWIHRALHHKSIYKYIHKVHHTHSAPFGIAAEYAHPAETLLLGFGTMLGPILFARHLLTLWIWLGVRLMETVEDHSGYELPFSPTNFIPFWGGAVHHDYHHKEFEGNYASVFTIWDWVFGTDEGFRASQLEKKDVQTTQWSDLIEKMGMHKSAAEKGVAGSKRSRVAPKPKSQ